MSCGKCWKWFFWDLNLIIFWGRMPPDTIRLGCLWGYNFSSPPCVHYLYTFKISSYAPRSITFHIFLWQQIYLIKSLDKAKVLYSTSLLMQYYSLYFAAQVIWGERSKTSSETRGTKESRQKPATREKKYKTIIILVLPFWHCRNLCEQLPSWLQALCSHLTRNVGYGGNPGTSGDGRQMIF